MSLCKIQFKLSASTDTNIFIEVDNMTRKHKKLLASAVILWLANLLFCLTMWLLREYDSICFDQFLYQMKASSEGTHAVLQISAFLGVGVSSVVATALEILLYLFFSGRLKNKLHAKSYMSYCATKFCSFFKKRALPLAVALLIFSCGIFTTKLDVLAYVDTISTESDFIEQNYADPDETTLTFPKQKRNLIYIFLESMESTYADTSAGTPIMTDYIPQLTALAKNNVSFSNTTDIGGARMYSGTSWTAAALVTQTSGVNVKIPITADEYGGNSGYMSGITTLGDILEQQGYNQTILFGSDAEFASRGSYFREHGNYNILDTNALKEQGRLPEDYEEWWGFEDEKLFSFAKEELSKLASDNKPFNFTMLTADTHFPDGYNCPQCKNEHSEQYANVLSCSARQVKKFVSWIKKQPFYENTTIVICGDHLTMDPNFLEEVNENYTRTIYNCIINSPVSPVKEKNRDFGTFDMFPTTLAAMGVKIDGNQLGLGVNLFSDKETLTEKYGFDQLNIELQKKSKYYNTEFFEPK